MKNIIVTDKTLNGLNGRNGASLLFREKTAIAKKLDLLGIDRIELPPIIKEREDKIVAKTLCLSVKNSVAVMPATLSKSSVDSAIECFGNNKNCCIGITVPVSTVTMEYEYHKKDIGMIELVKEVFTYAKSKWDNIEFIAKDATRSNPEFLNNCIKAAIDSGANAVTLCDSEGTFMPEEWSELVKRVKSICTVSLFIEVSNSLNLAVASALSGVISGADGVKTAIFGKDMLDTVDFANVINSRKNALALETNLKMESLKSDIGSLLRGTDTKEKENNISGSDDAILTSESTVADVKFAVENLGYTVSSKDINEVYKSVMRICEKKSSITAKELEAVVASSAMQVASTYHLESYNASCGNKAPSMVHIVLKSKNDTLSGVAVGNGPIDAAFMAIEQCLGHHYELDAFQIEAVTEGKEALGSAIVRLRNDGTLYSGNGLSSDIVGASIRAYLNALNKIVATEENYEA